MPDQLRKKGKHSPDRHMTPSANVSSGELHLETKSVATSNNAVKVLSASGSPPAAQSIMAMYELEKASSQRWGVYLPDVELHLTIFSELLAIIPKGIQ